MSFLLLVLETALAPLAGLGVILSFLLSSKRGRLGGLREEMPERFGGIREAALEQLRGREIWWFHAASAGEVAGLAPLLKALHERTSLQLVVTTTTRSGRDAARALPWVAWAQLAPLDAWPFVSRFLETLRPRRLVLTETELWPTTILLAARAGLRPALVNARMTPRSASRYWFASPFLSPVLRTLAVVAAQSAEDGERFVSLGVPRELLVLAGNTKYDQAPADAPAAEARDRARALGWSGAPLFVAGSTHPFEEEMVLSAFLAARRKVPELRFVLAPRHLERATDAADLLARAGLTVARWSAGSAARADALLLDEMGMLAGFYPLARVAFVGGTLVNIGGHNLLEPALAGVPVLFGPHTEHIERPAELLAAHGGGGRLVRDASELAARVEEFAKDEDAARAAGAAARATAERLRGATARTLAALEWAGV